MDDLDPRVIWLWRFGRLVRFGLFWLPASLIAGGAVGGVGGGGGGGAGAGLTIAVGWPRLAYAFWGYAVREHDLLIQQGVFWRRRSAIPLNRIQHVETRQGPFERAFGLSRVMVFTASGVAADGFIPGLATDRAESLRDELSRRGGEDDGV